MFPFDKTLKSEMEKSDTDFPWYMEDKGNEPSMEMRMQRFYASPILYVTPDPAPIPNSPSSYPPSPSPYIVNHKRRVSGLLKSFSEGHIVESHHNKEEEQSGASKENKQTKHVDEIFNFLGSTIDPIGCQLTCNNDENEIKEASISDELMWIEGSSLLPDVTLEDNESEDLLDLREYMNVDGNRQVEENGGMEQMFIPNTPFTPYAEYFDASAEIERSLSFRRDLEVELHEIRSNLLVEIERRKRAEQALHNMQNRWNGIHQTLSTVGLTIETEHDGKPNADSWNDLCQQVLFTRILSEFFGREMGNAEIEMEMESTIESKNFEIQRLLDRLHYYEAVNHEMSQRNQVVVEKAREHRLVKKRRWKLFWSSFSIAIIFGSTALAWSYFSVSEGSVSIKTNGSELMGGETLQGKSE